MFGLLLTLMPWSPPGLLQLALTDLLGTITVRINTKTTQLNIELAKFESLQDRSYSAGLYLIGGFLILVDLLTGGSISGSLVGKVVGLGG